MNDWRLTVLCVSAMMMGLAAIVYSIGHMIKEIRLWRNDFGKNKK